MSGPQHRVERHHPLRRNRAASAASRPRAPCRRSARWCRSAPTSCLLRRVHRRVSACALRCRRAPPPRTTSGGPSSGALLRRLRGLPRSIEQDRAQPGGARRARRRARAGSSPLRRESDASGARSSSTSHRSVMAPSSGTTACGRAPSLREALLARAQIAREAAAILVERRARARQRPLSEQRRAPSTSASVDKLPWTGSA